MTLLSIKQNTGNSFLTSYKNSYLSYFLMYAFYYLSWALAGALISVYLMGKGFAAAQVSLVVSASFFASMFSQPVIGSLTDRYGYKTVNLVMFAGTIFTAVMFLLSANLIMTVISYSLLMLLLNGSNPVMEKIATASPYSYGKIRIWGTIGYAAGTQLAGILYDVVSPEAIYISFLVTMTLCIAGFCGTDSDIRTAKKEENSEKTSLRSFFTNRRFLYYLILAGIFSGATSAGNTYIPSMLTHDGMDTSLASTILSLAVICEAPLVLLSGKFMDRFTNKTLLSVSFIMVFCQLTVYAFDMPVALKVIATLIVKHPAGMLLIMTNLKVINTIVDHRQQITALAFVKMVQNLASIIFNNISGNVLDLAGYASMFRLNLVLIAVGCILLFFYRIPSGNDRKLFS